MKKCSEPGSYKNGECCCNCHFLRKVKVHPWHKNVVNIPDDIFACTMMPMVDGKQEYNEHANVILMDEHGMCEMHTPRAISKNT